MEHDSSQPAPPGVKLPSPPRKDEASIKTPNQVMATIIPTSKGVENAKKRLRAFSIQKKAPLSPVIAPKPSGTGNTMVLIGKLSGVKSTKRDEDLEPKIPKLPKPPKPGTMRKPFQDSRTEVRKRTLAEIEEMKRKMELVDLGIPLGLIYPSSTSDKAMPTKAMPPIKSFIDSAKVEELICEAKKAKLEGKKFKFDYQKLLPGYDNPFQRKKDDASHKDRDKDRDADDRDREKKSDRRRSDYKEKRDKYSSKRYSDYRKHDRIKDRDKEKSKIKEAERNQIVEVKETDKADKETDVNFGDYLVCDSWSLDNDEKTSTSSPKFDDKSDSQSSTVTEHKVYKEPSQLLKASIAKKNEIIKNNTVDKHKQMKLIPVIDSFKYEIDDTEEVLDIFDAESNIDKFATVRPKKFTLYDSPDKNAIDLDDSSRDLSLDGINDDTFLESVINEIKVGELSEDESQDKGLVEYEISPSKDETPNTSLCESVTPERVTKERKHDDSDGYRSTESGYKTSDTVESGYKSGAEFRLSIEKELDDALNASKMPKATLDSLEIWTFVLKICQPLLFRHDRNNCYKETISSPKIWYTTNPKLCSCVKDRSIIYEELEMCKMNLVDRVYGCDQISDEPFPKCRNWYPVSTACLAENTKLQLSSEWEADDSQQSLREGSRRSLTPKREELALDREYQRFMEAVWPDVVDSKQETSRSTTPVQENRKKRKEESEKREEEKREEEKRAKKIKLSSEGWSQESDVEEDDRGKKVKDDKEKNRKRKHSSSITSSTSDSEDESNKKKRALKKKAMKKVKSKSAKRRRMGKKLLKKLKEKEKKNKKIKEKDFSEDDSESDDKVKRSKKKKLEKAKKREKKKRKTRKESSSDSSSSTSSDSEIERKKTKKKKEKNKKKRRKSSEFQSEEMFDVNILNNIKTEKITDDEGPKLLEFSPRRQKPREIINVKELQNDFVGNTNIKEEVEEKQVTEKDSREVQQEKETQIVEESLSPVVENSEKSEFSLKESAEEISVEAIDKPTGSKELTDENSQCSSQESVYSVKASSYEKDESHLRPSSQNSNYSFKDVMSANQGLYKEGGAPDCVESYEPAEYELYEHMAMAYQSDVAKQPTSPGGGSAVSRIETVVRARSCGEIKCDWRAGHSPTRTTPHRPSRWGLKPGEVNIVLTGGECYQQSPQPVYRIQSLANRNDTNTPIGYDEAYMDTYGALDRLQYGDCFSTDAEAAAEQFTETQPAKEESRTSTLDDRINQALRETVLGDVAKELDADDQDTSDKPNVASEGRGAVKRVRFADGYAPGQDSDTEPPPTSKRSRARRVGCAWPCPATHPDHVSLWDALPPPPPPPGSPPPPARRLRLPPRRLDSLVGLGPPGFMPPEPPPGLIALH